MQGPGLLDKLFIFGGVDMVHQKRKAILSDGFSFLPYGNRKAAKKTVRWTVFRPWEIPMPLKAA